MHGNPGFGLGDDEVLVIHCRVTICLWRYVQEGGILIPFLVEVIGLGGAASKA